MPSASVIFLVTSSRIEPLIREASEKAMLLCLYFVVGSSRQFNRLPRSWPAAVFGPSGKLTDQLTHFHIRE